MPKTSTKITNYISLASVVETRRARMLANPNLNFYMFSIPVHKTNKPHVGLLKLNNVRKNQFHNIKSLSNRSC